MKEQRFPAIAITLRDYAITAPCSPRTIIDHGVGGVRAGLPRKPPAVPPEFANLQRRELQGKAGVNRAIGFYCARGLLPNSQEQNRRGRCLVRVDRGPARGWS